MKQPARITLEDWASEQFGDRAPTMDTLRKWARDGLILPAAEKIGRTWFVTRDARYVPMQKVPPAPQHTSRQASNDAGPGKGTSRLVDRIRA